MFSISLQYKNNLYYSKISSGSSITFGSGKNDSVHIDEMCEAQYTITSNGNMFQIKTNGTFSQIRENCPLDKHIKLDNTGQNIAFITKSTAMSTQKFRLPYDGNITFGRSDKNDVVIKLPFISGRHFIVRCNDGKVRVEDCNSTNGLYLNGRRINSAVMNSGDVLNILTTRIHLINGVLLFENVGNAFDIKWCEEKNNPDINSRVSAKNKQLNYRRSPRIRERLPQDDIILSNPPAAAQEFDPGNNLANIINYGTMMATSIAYGMANPVMLALRTASSASNMFFSRKRNNEIKQKLETYEHDRREKYTAYMQAQLARITKVAEVQQRIISNENPGPKSCIESAMELRRNLWERSPSDDDFLNVRLGMGPNDLCVKIKSRTQNSGFVMQTDDMEELCEHVAEEGVVLNAPIRIPLRKYSNIGVIGDRNKVRHLVRNMIISLTTLHPYQDVRIVGIFDKEERSAWSALRWLPHIWDENKQFRFLAFDRERAHVVCELLNDVATKRICADDNGINKSAISLPYYILVFGSRDMTEHEQLMQTLALNSTDIGMTALYLYDDIYYLPQYCEYIIELNNNSSAYERLAMNYRTYFEPDESVERSIFDRFSRQLSAINLEDFKQENSLPNSITFFEGYGVKRAEELNIAERWNFSNASHSLAAPIGVSSSGKTFSLNVHSKADGPHGLVAGTTGSGKSEFIQSWILSMAVNYHPYEVNFIIIDYKGGSMANLLKPLPHVVGVITNIDSNIQRVLVSISAETKRREEILKENGNISFEQYQRLYKINKVSEPLPHLIVVSDEFAELKAEEPEFMSALTNFARVGRSLGIHVILATQKPGGIVNDQIDSNSRFRVCMKVNDAADSRELLKRPDAATITQAGRGYVRVGNDEIFELIQTYYSGAEYNPKDSSLQKYKNKVRIVDMTGQRIALKKDDEKTMKENESTELEVIIKHINLVAYQLGIKKLPGLWCEELPKKLFINDLGVNNIFNGTEWQNYSGKLIIPIGIFDSPYTQTQGIQYLDLSRKYHYALYGGPASGKTNLLKTIIMSIALSYSPKDINIYAMDFGGRSTSAFEDLPHVGCVALDYEEDKLQKLVRMLLSEREDRIKRFQQHKLSSFSAYKIGTGEDMPEIVIAVDNLFAAIKQYPFLQEFFEKIVSDGSTYGIHFIFTANSQNGIGQKILTHISGIIALKMNDRTEYNSYVGSVQALSLPNQPGSAVIKQDPPLLPLKFQAALFASGDNEMHQNESLKELSFKMKMVSDVKVKGVKIMPENIDISSLSEQYSDRKILPVGIEYSDLQTAFIRLDGEYVLNICGERIEDTLPFLHSLVTLLSARRDNEVYIFDSVESGLKEYADNSAGYACYADHEAFKHVFNKIIDIMNERQKSSGIVNCERNQICVVVNDILSFSKMGSEMANKAMSAICRIGKGLDIIVIVSSSAGELADSSMTNSIAKCVIASQKAIAVSGKPLLYSCYDNSLNQDEKTKPLGEKSMIFDNRNIRYIKSPAS